MHQSKCKLLYGIITGLRLGKCLPCTYTSCTWIKAQSEL